MSETSVYKLSRSSGVIHVFLIVIIPAPQWYSRECNTTDELQLTSIGDAYEPPSGKIHLVSQQMELLVWFHGHLHRPVKELCYIRFTSHAGNSGTLNAWLKKNGTGVFAFYLSLGVHNGGANGMPLVLERGDRLWIKMSLSHSVFDGRNVSTFSSSLIVPM